MEDTKIMAAFTDWVFEGNARDYKGNVIPPELAFDSPVLNRIAKDAFLAFNGEKSDTGNAERLELRFGEKMRAVGGEWVIYDGKAWRRNKSKLATENMKDVNRAIRDEARFLDDTPTGKKGTGPSERDDHNKYSVRCGSARSIADALKLAMTSLDIDADEFDKHKELLNTPSGVIDLRTGELMPHSPALMLTGITAEDYDPEADTSGIDEMADIITSNKDGSPNPERKNFIKTFFGYCLRADNREKALLIITGDETDDNRNGNNGKTTLVQFFTDVLGSDITGACNKDIICRDGGRAPDARSRLPLLGRRMVYGAELGRTDIIDAPALKLITGEERVTIKSLYADEFEGRITATPIVYSQVMPRVNEAHSAVWDRIFRVIFPVYFYTENSDPASISAGYSIKADKEKVEAMRADPAFRAGVMKWLVEGAVEYHKNGLPKFEEAKSSLAEVKRSSDPVLDFVNDCLIPATEDHKIKAADLYLSYSMYCAINSVEPISQRAFGDAMTGRGFASKNVGGYTSRLNVAFSPIGYALKEGMKPDHAMDFVAENEGNGATYRGSMLPKAEIAHFKMRKEMREGDLFGPYRITQAPTGAGLDQDLVESVRKSATQTGRKAR